jgi:hypothetical protein
LLDSLRCQVAAAVHVPNREHNFSKPITLHQRVNERDAFFRLDHGPGNVKRLSEYGEIGWFDDEFVQHR